MHPFCVLIRLSVSEPNDSESDLIIGNMIPPARAVLLGVAGARIKSTPTIEYAKPNVFYQII